MRYVCGKVLFMANIFLFLGAFLKDSILARNLDWRRAFLLDFLNLFGVAVDRKAVPLII